MTLSVRPGLLAVSEFGAPSSGDAQEKEWWPLLHALIGDEDGSTLSDAEVGVLVGLLGTDGGDDLYGLRFVFLDMILKSPGFPQNLHRLKLSEENIWQDILLAKAGNDTRPCDP